MSYCKKSPGNFRREETKNLYHQTECYTYVSSHVFEILRYI